MIRISVPLVATSHSRGLTMEDRNMMLLVLAYCLLGFCCYWHWQKDDRTQGLYRLALVTFLPVFGYLLLLVDWLSRQHKADAAYLWVLEAKEHCDGGRSWRLDRRGVDMESELNVVPMEEALILNTASVRRRMVLDILKDDLFRYTRLLRLAMGNEDMETSHYATTAIMEIRRKILLDLHETDGVCDLGDSCLDRLVSKAENLKKVLDSSLLDGENASIAVETLKRILEQTMATNPQNENLLADLVNCHIAQGDYPGALGRCHDHAAANGQTEQVLVMLLKIAYLLRNRDVFLQALDSLEGLPRVDTQLAVDTMQFWRFLEVRT
jgi:hypothetical protein